jgi:hypothetical protein
MRYMLVSKKRTEGSRKYRSMKSSTTASFRNRLRELPPDVLAKKNFRLWLRDSHHPSLHLKKVGRFWSARVGVDHRAVARVEGDAVKWL